MSCTLTDVHCCTLCKALRDEVGELYYCESCLRIVCKYCLQAKSSIPYMGKTKRTRVCQSCILCYSYCQSTIKKNYICIHSLSDSAFGTYSSFAESQCCGDQYSHVLHESERNAFCNHPYNSFGDFKMTPLWVPDTMSSDCYECKIKFSFFNRKHHCRLCGRIFCKVCTSKRIDLTKYGYPLTYCTTQRVCNTCASRLEQEQTNSFIWDDIAFSVKVTIASYLPITSVSALSAVNHATHRQFTSRDFDQTFWKFMFIRINIPDFRLIELISPHQSTSSHDSPEVSANATGGSWRLMYVTCAAIPASISCSLFFLQHPAISLRIAALQQLRSDSTRQATVVQEAVQHKDAMVSLIKCLQVANNEIKKEKVVSAEILQLLLLSAGCLLNVTQTSQTISKVFRENEGITTVLALLDNDYIKPTTTPITDFAHSSDPSIHSFSPRKRISPLSISLTGDTYLRKVVLYLTGILMNLCRLDCISCREVGQMRGMEVLVNLISISHERQILYSLECIKSCCKSDTSCKDTVGCCGGITRLINCFASTSSQVVFSAVTTASVVLAKHPANLLLFCYSNGLDALMQIEEKWLGRCGVCAAKTISNILCDEHTVNDFLLQCGLSRLCRLLQRNREDLSGLLLGHLMNCAIYSKIPVFVPAPLLSAMIGQIWHYLTLAREEDDHLEEFIPMVSSLQEHNTDETGHTSPLRIMDCNTLSDDTRDSDMSSITHSSQEDGRQDAASGTSLQLPVLLGYGAGAFRYLANNEVNSQLFLDFGVDSLLEVMLPYCDTQGVLFISFYHRV